MPNPLSKVSRDAPVVFGVNALEQRPDMARRIGLIVSAWSYVEHAQALLLAKLLGTKARIAVAIWEKLTSAALAKREVLQAAAEAVLPDEDLLLFNALMALVRSRAKERNTVAHGMWAYSATLSDALLLIPSNDILDMRASASRHPVEAVRRRRSPLLFDSVMVYTASDFDRIYARIFTVQQDLEVFRELVDGPPEQHGEIRQRLSRAPEILEFLRTGPPPSPRQSPPPPEPQSGE